MIQPHIEKTCGIWIEGRFTQPRSDIFGYHKNIPPYLFLVHVTLKTITNMVLNLLLLIVCFTWYLFVCILMMYIHVAASPWARLRCHSCASLGPGKAATVVLAWGLVRLPQIPHMWTGVITAAWLCPACDIQTSLSLLLWWGAYK